MSNTKEVEQAAERKTLDMLLEYFVDHKNMDGPITDDELKKEYESEFNLAMDLAIFGYNYALSNSLEQSELQQQYNKLKEAFEYACKEYIHEDVIEECMNRAGLEQSEKKEEEITDEGLMSMGFDKSAYNNMTYFFHGVIVEINIKVYGNTCWIRFRDQDIKPLKNLGDLKSTVFAMTEKNL